jgi:hypothetical protein
MAEIPIYCNGRAIGKVTGRTFVKVITGSKHFLRKPTAIAFDRSTLADARKAGATVVAVTDRETAKVYRATIDDIEAHGVPVNRGYGDQLALCVLRFSINGKVPGWAEIHGSNTERKAAQASLFDMAVMP